MCVCVGGGACLLCACIEQLGRCMAQNMYTLVWHTTKTLLCFVVDKASVFKAVWLKMGLLWTAVWLKSTTGGGVGLSQSLPHNDNEIRTWHG